MTRFGKLLKKIRIDYGELLYNMAKKLDVSSSFLSAVENGTKPVPLDWPQRIGNLYNLDNGTVQALTAAADETAKQIRIPLDHANLQQRSLAMAFARKFDSFEQDQIDALLRSFSTHDTKDGDPS